MSEHKRLLEEFRSGDLLEWQTMREMVEQLEQALDKVIDLVGKIVDNEMAMMSQISEIKTRLDDVEQFAEDVNVTTETHWHETPSRDYLEGQADILEQTGTHAPDCRCGWCEPPEGFIDQWSL